MNERYFERMRAQLSDFAAYRACLSQPPYRGIRVNTLKISPDAFREIAPFALAPAAWEPNGFLISEEKPGKYFYHDAGLYYVQEPSAMCAVPLLGARPGERVLDLCSAPGGKGTQIAQAMQGKGLLVLNEKMPDRAKVLLQNVERMGIANAVVTCAEPSELAARLPAFFDRILVDAPCSGEGMLRKEPAAAENWSEENVLMCAERQKKILESAVSMLAPGGTLVYSTCTFAPEEDEANADWLVRAFPELTCTEQKKVYPHRERGEGHFAARFIKEDGARAPFRAPKLPADRAAVAAYRAFAGDFLRRPPEGTFASFGNSLCLLPGEVFPLGGLRVLRCGLQLGTMEGRRFVPAHALALGVPRQDIAALCNYPQEDIARYLHGEELPAAELRGWCAVAYEGWPIGLGKSSASMKNHYPKGLRRP